MTLETISQLGIGLFGSIAFLLVLSEDTRKQKLGCIFGFISNPFWWLQVIVYGQWYSVPVHMLYTYGWIRKGCVLWSIKSKLKHIKRSGLLPGNKRKKK